MIHNDKGAAEEKQWIAQLDDGEVSQVAGVDAMACDAEGRQGEGEAVDQAEEDLRSHDAVDEISKESSGEDTMFFDEFGEIVQPARD